MSYIGPITQDILDAFIKELKKRDTMTKISKNIIDPIFAEIMIKIWKYYFGFIFLQIIIIVLLFYLIVTRK